MEQISSWLGKVVVCIGLTTVAAGADLKVRLRDGKLQSVRLKVELKGSGPTQKDSTKKLKR